MRVGEFVGLRTYPNAKRYSAWQLVLLQMRTRCLLLLARVFRKIDDDENSVAFSNGIARLRCTAVIPTTILVVYTCYSLTRNCYIILCGCAAGAVILTTTSMLVLEYVEMVGLLEHCCVELLVAQRRACDVQRNQCII